MLYYEINQLSRTVQRTEIPLLGETQEDCFNRHIKRCTFNVGSLVRFKKPRKNPVRGTVTHIENDLSKITWTHNGTVPNYISVEVKTINKRTGVSVTSTVKTHEGKLMHTQAI